MDILYINVIEQNAGWGAETFLNNGFQSLGHNVTNLDFRKHRQVLATKLKQIPDFDVLFLQRGDRFPPYLLKSCNRPKIFWATELISRNRDQDILLKSNLFDHIFVRSDDCKKRALNNKWVDANNISVMLSGFDADLHKREFITKDIDVLFVGSMLSRREKNLGELQSEFNIKICQAYGEKMVQLFNRAKIVLNIHAEEFLDTETRIYEALGCGSFLISEKLSGENPFITGKHYIEVNDLKMMKDQIKYYLENQTEREEIALNGYHEAINKHTYYVRAKEFTKKFEEQTLKTETPAFNSRKLNIFSIYEQFKRFIKK